MKNKIFFGNFRIGSNLSRDGFMASQDLLGAQKLYFCSLSGTSPYFEDSGFCSSVTI